MAVLINRHISGSKYLSMKNRVFVLFISFLFIGKILTAQQKDATAVLQVISVKIGNEFPIVDSFWLQKPHGSNIPRGFTKQLGITGKEEREMNRQKPVADILSDSLFPSVTRIPLKKYLTAFYSSDTSFLNKYHPYYEISPPFFFQNNQKAFVHVFLTRVNRTGYILEKENGRWLIKKEVLFWGIPYP